MRVLITGDQGVIGTELKTFLKNHELMLVDKEKGFDLSKHPLDPIVEFDPEIVFHLAASFERLYESSEFFQVNQNDNILASTYLNLAISKCKSVKKYIFASSYLVYNDEYYSHENPEPPFRIYEKLDLKPRNLIGASKLYTEKEIEFIARNRFQYVFARIFRSYGNGSKDIVSRSIRDMLDKNCVFGTPTYHVENSFDFIHARDVAEALVKLSESAYYGAVNVGYGESVTMKRVFETIGCKTFPIDSPGLISRQYENSVCDNELLWEITGWVPSIDIHTGIHSVIDYERRRV